MRLLSALGSVALLALAAREASSQNTFASSNWPTGPNGLVNESAIEVPLNVATSTTFQWRGRTFTVPDQPITTTRDGCGDTNQIPGCASKEYVWNCMGKTIGFVFDDGPNYWTLDILNALKNANAKATFCMVGRMLITHPAGVTLLKAVIDAGHDICVHSLNHLHMSSLSNEQIAEEIMGNIQIFRDILGPSFIPRFIRPPFGDLDLRVKAVADTLGLKVLLWNLDTKDFVTDAAGNRNLSDYLAGYQSKLQSANTLGYFTLAHDIINATHVIFPQVLKMAQDAGYDIILPSNCTGLGRWVSPSDAALWQDYGSPTSIPNAQVTPYPFVYADTTFTGPTRDSPPVGTASASGPASAAVTGATGVTSTKAAAASATASATATAAGKGNSASKSAGISGAIAGLIIAAAVVVL
ncbi:chitin deacetylase [Gonapodya sp. JEL0774]|nr:chitin deacetylase [Gonapodya sp. JEL0774]